MSDDREKTLTNAYIQFIEESKYNRHFAGVPEQAVMESRLFLRLWDALQFHTYTPVPEGRAFVAGEEIVIIDGRGNHIPVPMILFCPACGSQHVDREEDHQPNCDSLSTFRHGASAPLPCSCDRWVNPPHRSHLCAGCRHIWRPSDVHTVGVAEISTQGSHDTPAPVRGRIGHLPTAKPDCMFTRCPSPTFCTKGCKHVRQLDKLGQTP